MGRRINISTPTVINTELVPLDESFYLEYDGQLEQWYYDNTEQYAPNRKVTPLLLSPRISAFDKDTATSYSPTFATTQWFAKEWDEQQQKYVETLITNNVDSASADYVIQGDNLLVKKNVSYSHAVSIRCLASYIDPRDSGVTYTVEDSVNLTTNRTADVVFPEVDIISPSGRAYNPLVDDENSQYDFLGVKTNNPVQPLTTDIRRYGVDVDGTEEIVENGKGVAPVMDIRYGEYLMADQEFMYRQTAGGTLVGESIDKAYIERIKGNTVAWNQMLDINKFRDFSERRITPENFELFVEAGYAYAYTNVSYVVGHKYYLQFFVKGSSNLLYVFAKDKLNNQLILYQDISNTTFKKKSLLFTGIDTYNSISIGVGGGTNIQLYVKMPMLFDLTLIYGAGKEPETVEEFEADYQKWFGKPLAYEEYDAGSLRPVNMTGVKSVGFNLFDESTFIQGRYRQPNNKEQTITGRRISDVYFSCLPNTEYYLCTNEGYTVGDFAIVVCWYDSDKNFISGTNGSNKKVTSPSNAAYFRVSSADSSAKACINISNPSKDGTYEPYVEKVQGFDVTAIKGKLEGAGESVTIFPDGMKKAGSVHDEIKVEDGVIKAIKRVGSVDLGTLNYNYSETRGCYSFDLTDAKYIAESNEFPNKFPNIITSRYNTVTLANGYYNKPDKSVHICILNEHKSLYIRDSAYSDATTFKSAMQGVMLYYELATPQTYVLDPITDFVWYGIKDNQEVLADTLPWYVSGQGTDKLTVDAMYGEYINVVLRCKMMDGETLSPSKAYASLSWRTPDIEPFVQSENGGAVRSNTEEMTFGTIININGEVLSDALKQKHLAFNWKIHKNNAAPTLPESEVDKGWGQRITIDASDLRNVKQTPSSTLASTLVYNNVYLKGAYEEVTDNGEAVTYNGEKVYDRPVD